MAACGGVEGPLRKLSLGDLHIRSRVDDRTSACREIRAILREIRDSLQQDASAAGSRETSAVGRTSKCVEKELHDNTASNSPSESSTLHQQRPSDAGCHRHRGRQRCSDWRHCRLSLPARWRPGQGDGPLNGEGDHAVSSRMTRRRVPANVRFADELGMNLNTFAMIPSRQGRDDSPSCTSQPWLSSTGRRHRSPPPPPRPQDVCTNVREDLLASDRQTTDLDDQLKTAEECQKPASNHEQFRLCFKQPFAELEQFRYRLDRQLVCLENVRVDDWTPAAAHHGAASNSTSESYALHQPSSLAANSVILCSIQTKNASRGDAKVFARCTSDNWRTYADLPAQRVTGLDSLGLGYDRYCFAVRRPATTSPLDRHFAAGTPSATVEFAVCYELEDRTFWDNNDETNYRIEWFENTT